MRILISSFTYPPLSGGVGLVAHNHAVGLAQRGFDVTIATAPNPLMSQLSLNKLNIKAFHFDVKGSPHPRSKYSGEIGKYQRFVAEFPAEVMIFHCWQIWSTDLAVKVFPLNPAKKILVSHGVSANSRMGWPRSIPNWLLWKPYLWWGMPKIIRAFDHVVFLSERQDKDRFYDRRLAERLGYGNFSVIPNGIVLSDFEVPEVQINFRDLYGIDTKYMLLCVGEYSRFKNQRLVLDAFISAAPRDATLVFIGHQKNAYSRALEEKWQAYRRRISASKMLCLEKLPRHHVLAAFRAADIFLFGSVTECFPMVILEAMGSRTPFISTDVGCISDLPGGLVIRNSLEMAQKISFLMENQEMREKLGNASEKACRENYTWDNIIDQYESLIRKIVNQ